MSRRQPIVQGPVATNPHRAPRRAPILLLATGLLAASCAEPVFTTSDAVPDARGGQRDAAAREDAAPDALETDAEPSDAQAPDGPAAPAEDAAAPPADGPAAHPLVGAWTSEGPDVAPLLGGPPAHLIRLEATFGADGTLVVDLTNERLQRFSLTGTYVTDTASDPAWIEVTQTDPEPARSEGLWRVEGEVLTYEVAQVEPPLDGVSPPDPEAGFGSTSGGRFGRDNVQTYRRVQ